MLEKHTHKDTNIKYARETQTQSTLEEHATEFTVNAF